MNGYPTDFGMTECIKLCASNKYNDKRVAYLGLMILVDETEEILMLMTNCLKQDLHNDELQIVSLALNVLGDIASVEMVRDLLPEIEKHLLSQNPYIRKKAVLASVRAVRKLSQEETTNILHHVPHVLDTSSPAVHIAVTALVAALCKQSSTNIVELRSSVAPMLLNILREHLLKKGRGSGIEPVIGGVRNPFLQVKIIASLRLLFESSAPSDLTEHLSDVLAQVAANTHTKKVAGCAVLYECVRTIMSVQTDPSLRVLAVETCAKFLGHREPSVRYIALQELTTIIDADGIGVLTHVSGLKEKVLGAMREADPTVRKRAVELGYRIADGTNIEEMVEELLAYITKSNSHEAKEDACWKIFMLGDRFGSSNAWKVEKFVRALSSADLSMPEDVITSFIALISANPEVQGHAVLTLFTEALAPRMTGGLHEDVDPFQGSKSSNSVPNNDSGSRATNLRKPRLERVALYVLGEHAEVTPSIGLDIPVVLNAFAEKLQASEVTDEPWMNTYKPEYLTENRILGETALTGLVKFAARAVCGASSDMPESDSILALAGPEHGPDKDPLQSLLAITAPPKRKANEDVGLGTDMLAELGLDDDKPKALHAGPSSALVTAPDLLGSLSGNSGALMSLGPEADESANPIVSRVRQILSERARSTDLEIQQRACEYLMLLNDGSISLLASAMAPMPPLDFESVKERARQRKELRTAMPTPQAEGQGGLLLDLLGDGGASGEEPLGLPASGGGDFLALPSSQSNANGTNDMTLEDIMGGPSQSVLPRPSRNVGFDLESLGVVPTVSHEAQASASGTGGGSGNAAILSTSIFESGSLHVSAQFYRDDSARREEILLELSFANKADFSMSSFVFLLAVPKYMKLDMRPASASDIAAGGKASQAVILSNSLQGQKPIQLRYRVEYVNDSTAEHVQEQGIVTGLEAL